MVAGVPGRGVPSTANRAVTAASGRRSRRRRYLGHGDDPNQKLIQAPGGSVLLMQLRHKENGG